MCLYNCVSILEEALDRFKNLSRNDLNFKNTLHLSRTVTKTSYKKL